MTAFLNDFSKFYGTGEKNEAGQNLEEFLELYDPRKYETPSNTTDAVIFAYEGESCDSSCKEKQSPKYWLLGTAGRFCQYAGEFR